MSSPQHRRSRAFRLELLESRLAFSVTGMETPFAEPFFQHPAFEPLAATEQVSALSQEAMALINLDDYYNDPRFQEFDGSGYSVVVIDSGIDVDHPFFGDRIVYQYDFADEDSDATDTTGHGSHVTSIIASEDRDIAGVLPGVNIIALKVFPDNSRLGNYYDVEQALQWTIDNSEAYNIAAVNMSLGAGNYGSYWTSGIIGDELQQLEEDNVVVVAAAGNSFGALNSQPGVSYPAADPHTIGVGATFHSDVGYQPWTYSTDFVTGPRHIVSFSQRHELLSDVFAPGSPILGASHTGDSVAAHGTSMAAPFVTGAAVIAQQLAEAHLDERITVSAFRDLLAESGHLINDGDDEIDTVVNTGLDFAFLDVYALAEQIWQPTTTSGEAVGVFRAGRVFFDQGMPGYQDEQAFGFGWDGDRAIAGDWDGNGFDEVGVMRDNRFFLDQGPSGFDGETYFRFGWASDIPIAGDWDGDGKDEVGVFRDGRFFLDRGEAGYQDESAIRFGRAGDVPIAGDWDGDSKDEVGVFRDGRFFLDTGEPGYQNETAFSFGWATDVPVAGDWDGDGMDEVGVFRNGRFFLDEGEPGFDGETSTGFGRTGDQPLIGNWNLFGDVSPTPEADPATRADAFPLWGESYGTESSQSLAEGDRNSDGVVNGLDFLAIQRSSTALPQVHEEEVPALDTAFTQLFQDWSPSQRFSHTSITEHDRHYESHVESSVDVAFSDLTQSSSRLQSSNNKNSLVLRDHSRSQVSRLLAGSSSIAELLADQFVRNDFRPIKGITNHE